MHYGVGITSHRARGGMIIELNERYVIDVLRHVAETYGISRTVSASEAAGALGRFTQWTEEVERSWPEIDYCEFGAFFATEIVQGRLYGELEPMERFKIGMELLVHLTLEGNLMNRDWEIVLDGSFNRIADVLVSPRGGPEGILRVLCFVGHE